MTIFVMIFFLFANLKKGFREWRFEDDADLKLAVEECFDKKSSTFYRERLSKLKNHYSLVINIQGGSLNIYFD